MRALRKYFAGIGRSFLTLGDGLAVTFSYLWRRPSTIQYPDRTAVPVVRMLPERSRGILEVDTSMCTACTMCAKQCPIHCIHVEIAKDPATNVRMLQRFDIDVSKCMFCGICQEACPAGGIRHTHEFEGAMADVKRLMLRFVDAPVPVAKPAKKDDPRPPAKPLGSIVRPLLANPWAPARPPASPPVIARKPEPAKEPAAKEPLGGKDAGSAEEPKRDKEEPSEPI